MKLKKIQKKKSERHFTPFFLLGSADKPVLMILFDETCESDVHCREIRKDFATNTDMIEIGKHFHMINAMGIDEHNQHWDPMIVNPWYTPRFFFLEAHVS